MKATGKQKWWVWQEKIWKKRGFWFWVVIFYRSIEAVAVRSYRPDNGGILSSLTDEKNQMGQCLREEEEKKDTCLPPYDIDNNNNREQTIEKKKNNNSVCVSGGLVSRFIFFRWDQQRLFPRVLGWNAHTGSQR